MRFGARYSVKQILATALVMVLHSGGATAAEQGGELELSISVPRDSILQSAPLPVAVTLRNRATEPVKIMPPTLEPEILALTFQVTDPSGDTWPAKSMGQASTYMPEHMRMTLKPGEALTYVRLLVNGPDQGFFFDEAGEYQMKAIYEYSQEGEPTTIKSDEVAFDVAGPNTKAQKAAHQLFRAVAEPGVSEEDRKALSRLLVQYPSSAYAPYARYVLGLEHLAKDDHDPNTKALAREFWAQSLLEFTQVMEGGEGSPLYLKARYQRARALERLGWTDWARAEFHWITEHHSQSYEAYRVGLKQKNGG